MALQALQLHLEKVENPRSPFLDQRLILRRMDQRSKHQDQLALPLVALLVVVVAIALQLVVEILTDLLLFYLGRVVV